jgi:NDP-sugar pyrophosphorylase family protein
MINKVVIMAGGQGTRLDPFTKIIPKPLIPINNKPIIEKIMQKFNQSGFFNFILSLNYKAETIQSYFTENFNQFNNIEYVIEPCALGTGGSLRLMNNKLTETFIVANCDTIIDINFHDALLYHKEKNNDATIIGVKKEIQIPYGVIKETAGEDLFILEKPKYDFIINSGIYILEPKIIDFIFDNEFIHMPDILLRSKQKGSKIGLFYSDCKWFDIGQWEEYKETLEYFKEIGE